MLPIKAITVHCSATPPTSNIGVSDITRWHRSRGFLKIGYHYVIRRDGTVEKGRADTEVGAHVQWHNRGNLGICLVGGVNDNQEPDNNFTQEQMESLTKLLKELKGKYPQADILGHRDWPGVAKACPCFDVKTWVKIAISND